MRTWRSFLRLTPSERHVAVEAALALAATWLALRLAGFRLWKKTLAWNISRETTAATEVSLNEITRIVRVEQAAAGHLFFRTNCLEQSLVLWWLLRRRGVAADLTIGGRKAANGFEAHAWVELGGVTLNGTAEDHLAFVPFEENASWMELN